MILFNALKTQTSRLRVFGETQNKLVYGTDRSMGWRFARGDYSKRGVVSSPLAAVPSAYWSYLLRSTPTCWHVMYCANALRITHVLAIVVIVRKHYRGFGVLPAYFQTCIGWEKIKADCSSNASSWRSSGGVLNTLLWKRGEW